MKCPECGNTNPATASECEFCGHALAGGQDRRTRIESAPMAAPDPAKRRTVFEPNPDRGLGQGGQAGPSARANPVPADPFANPLPRRSVYDPNDPFRAALAPQAPQGAPPAGVVPTGSNAPTSGPIAAPDPGKGPPKGATLVERAPARRAAGVLLVLSGPDDPGRVVPLYDGRNTVGRDEGQDVRLEDGRVSAQHGFFFLRADGTSFIDVSTNGSLVDGKVLHGQQVDIPSGSALKLGNTLLVFTRLAAVPAGAWTP